MDTDTDKFASRTIDSRHSRGEAAILGRTILATIGKGAARAYTHLYDPHGQPGLLRQLLPDVPGGLRGRREGRLQDLQLLRFYGGPRTASFRAGTAVAATTAGAAVRALVLRLAVPRLGIAVQGTYRTDRNQAAASQILQHLGPISRDSPKRSTRCEMRIVARKAAT